MNQRCQTFISDQSGAIAVMVALLLTVLLSAAALAVDYGYMAWVQGDLQKASDAGALAGARVLGSDANPDWAAGQAAATSIVQQNKAGGRPLTDCQVDYGYWSRIKPHFAVLRHYASENGCRGHPSDDSESFREKRRSGPVTVCSHLWGPIPLT